jgi:hypothetical protein
VVWTERKRVEKLRYIHRNPVKRGLVLEPEQWKWSSYRYYAFGERGPVLVNEQVSAKLRLRGRALESKKQEVEVRGSHPSKTAKGAAALG